MLRQAAVSAAVKNGGDDNADIDCYQKRSG